MKKAAPLTRAAPSIRTTETQPREGELARMARMTNPQRVDLVDACLSGLERISFERTRDTLSFISSGACAQPSRGQALSQKPVSPLAFARACFSGTCTSASASVVSAVDALMGSTHPTMVATERLRRSGSKERAVMAGVAPGHPCPACFPTMRTWMPGRTRA